MSAPAGYGFDENADKYRCHCCCCSCCHIKICCIILLIIEVIGCAITIVHAALALHHGFLSDGAMAYIIIVNLIIPILFIIAICLCFYAIWKVKAKLVLPHLIMQFVYLIVLLVNAILAILLITRVSYFYSELVSSNAQNFGGVDTDDIDVFDVLDDNRIGATVTAGVVISWICVFLIQALILVFFIYCFIKLRRYLTDKEAYLRGTGQNIAMKGY